MSNHIVSLTNTDDWTLRFNDQDVRGYRALNEEGVEVGTVQDMLIDTSESRVSTIVLDNDESYPASDIAIDDGVIYITGKYPVNTNARHTRDIRDYGTVRRQLETTS